MGRSRQAGEARWAARAAAAGHGQQGPVMEHPRRWPAVAALAREAGEGGAEELGLRADSMPKQPRSSLHGARVAAGTPKRARPERLQAMGPGCRRRNVMRRGFVSPQCGSEIPQVPCASELLADQDALLHCINRCRRSTTTGNRRRAELQCVAALERPGAHRGMECAAAARRIGTWLAGVQLPPAQVATS